MFVFSCGITATSAVQALGSPPRTNTLRGVSPPPHPPCRPECCCRRNSQQGGRVGKRRKLSVAMMSQEKLFGLRGRLKSCRVMTFGSISTPLFLFRHQVCICGNGSRFVSQKTFGNRCEKSKKENRYGLRSQPLLNKQNYL